MKRSDLIIAVASGKGGTGKTLVSTSLALSVGACTYVDLDVEEPNGYHFLKPIIDEEVPFFQKVPEIDLERCTFCGRCARDCVFNALAVVPALKKAMLFPELCHSCGVCTHTCPVPGAIKEVERETGRIRMGQNGRVRFIEGRLKVGQPSGVPLIAGILDRYLDQGGPVFLDAPPGTSCPMVESLQTCDFALLVTEPTPFGKNDLELALEVVEKLGKKCGIIINKDRGQSGSIEELAKRTGIPVLLKIPYSLDIQEAYSRGIPLVESRPELAAEFRKLATGLGRKT